MTLRFTCKECEWCIVLDVENNLGTTAPEYKRRPLLNHRRNEHDFKGKLEVFIKLINAFFKVAEA